MEMKSNLNKIAFQKKGFNWATSFQTWKYSGGEGRDAIAVVTVEFQLGHVFSDMEILEKFGKDEFC